MVGKIVCVCYMRRNVCVYYMGGRNVLCVLYGMQKCFISEAKMFVRVILKAEMFVCVIWVAKCFVCVIWEAEIFTCYMGGRNICV